MDLLPLAFSAHFSFRSLGFFCLPVQRFLTAVINPFLARPETPLPCAVQVSEDQETLFPHHQPLHVLRQPGCFPHGILVLPLPAENAHTELVGESLLPSFSFTLESRYCKTKLTTSVLFFLHVPSKWNNSLHLHNLHFLPFPSVCYMQLGC